MNATKLTKYDGTVHPEEWVKQIQLFYYDKNIRNEQEIVDNCKLLIHNSIQIPPEANSFVAIINTLKSDVTYEIFKNSVKKKLRTLKFHPHYLNTNENVNLMLNNFRQLCHEGEITEVEEQKKLFLNALPKEFFPFQHSFINYNFDKINSMKELIKYFDESFVEESKSLKNGSCITLKHVATGKYLSSFDNTVFAAKKEPENGEQENRMGIQSTVPGDILWIVTKHNFHHGKTIYYGDSFQLIKKDVTNYVGRNLHVSPEVCLSNQHTLFHCVNANSKNSPYVKTKDFINLQSDQDNFVLRSHEITFTADNKKTYQEVIGHKERIGENDEWCIELVENV